MKLRNSFDILIADQQLLQNYESLNVNDLSL